jgi:hypothetical protein
VTKIVPEPGKALGRRDLVESRRLATAQEELREAVRELLDSEKEVSGSDALVDMHDLVDQGLADSKRSLGEGKPADALPPASDVIEALAAIVAALDEGGQQGDDDMFAEQEGGASGGGGGGSQAPAGVIPPVAEVKLLRSMQDAIARRTRALDESSATMDPVTRAQLLGEIAAKQARILELGSKLAEKIRGGAGTPGVTPGTSDGDTGGDGDRGGSGDDGGDS